MGTNRVRRAAMGVAVASTAVWSTAVPETAHAATARVLSAVVSGQMQYAAALGPLPVATPEWLLIQGTGVAVMNSTPLVVGLACDMPGNGSDAIEVGLGNVAGGCAVTGITPTITDCHIVDDRAGTLVALSGTCDWSDGSTTPMHGALLWELQPDLHTAAVGGSIVIGLPA